MQIVATTVLSTILLLSWHGGQLPTSSRQHISYEDFMKLELATRKEMFYAISAENRCEIMRTHSTRWLATNRSRLNPAQVAIVQDMINLMTPPIYELPRTAKTLKLLEPMAEAATKAAALLPREDLLDMATTDGAYIPAKK